MRRRTFDILVSSTGMMLTIVLLVAGGLLYWGYSFANNNVRRQAGRPGADPVPWREPARAAAQRLRLLEDRTDRPAGCHRLLRALAAVGIACYLRGYALTTETRLPSL